MLTPKTVHVFAIIKQYLHDFHVTTVPCAQSRFALSDVPPEQVAASKKKEFVWTNDEAELLLAVIHNYKIKRLVEGTSDYQQTYATVFIQVFVFAFYTSVYERFYLLRFQGLHLGLQIQKSLCCVSVFNWKHFKQRLNRHGDHQGWVIPEIAHSIQV